MSRAISIGAQDFEQLISNHCFYVDKTLFIKEWWESQDIVTLITRPRRFGKTLNMSMLECFFSLKYQGRGELFEGLNKHLCLVLLMEVTDLQRILSRNVFTMDSF